MTTPIYQYVGPDTGYNPQISGDMVVEFSLSPSQFKINSYIDYKAVPTQRGNYVSMLNDGQTRVLNDTDNIWADGAERPQKNITDAFILPEYQTVRRNEDRKYGWITQGQSAWDVLAQGARLCAMQLMTGRTKRIHETLTTSANWAWGPNGANTNYNTATGFGGAPWSTASSTNPYIRQTLKGMINLIIKSTNNVVQASDLMVVMNENTAGLVSLSGEFLDFVKQNPTSIQIWENDAQFATYGLPRNLYGLNLLVDATQYNSAGPNQTPVLAPTFPDNYVVVMTKPRAVNPAAAASFSTFCLFAVEDFYTEIEQFPYDKLTRVNVTENVCTSSQGLIAPQSGALCLITS